MSGVGGIPNTEADSSRGNESTPQQIHQEGAQYVREATQANQQSMSNAQSSGEGTTGTSFSRSVPEPIREQPPASNPGADDPTGGIGKDAGGVSGSAYIESPVQNEEQGIVNTVKQFLGLSVTEEKRAEDTQPAWNDGSVTALSGIGATTAAPAVALAAASGSADHQQSNKGAFTAEIPDRTKPSTLSNTEPRSAAGYSISTGPDYDDNRRSVPLESNRTSDNSTTTPLPSTLTNPAYSEADPAVTAGSHSTKTGADSSSSTANRMEDSEPRHQQSHEHHASNESGSGEHGHSEKSEEKKHGAKAENPDAIPTAGGEKLGEKHWGESQIVPELPPKRNSDAGQGVSSSAGQPNCEFCTL